MLEFLLTSEMHENTKVEEGGTCKDLEIKAGCPRTRVVRCGVTLLD